MKIGNGCREFRRCKQLMCNQFLQNDSAEVQGHVGRLRERDHGACLVGKGRTVAGGGDKGEGF